MKKEQKASKTKRSIGIFICSYFLSVAAYYLGETVGKKQGLEYRFWVDACFRFWVWFVPIIFVGIILLKLCIRQWKHQSFRRWIMSVMLVVYTGAAVYFSLIYVLVSLFTLTTDEKMPDGNLVVAVPNGMEALHCYAEPVGLFFRRDFSFDEERTAESLSKIYGITFQPLRKENDQWVYGSQGYPDVELTNITYGFTETSYLDCDFGLKLTSKMLETHQDVFESRGVELVSYIYGCTKANPEGQGSCTAVLVSEENKEHAAEAIAEFIKITLQEDLRSDGKSIWDCVNGSIFLVTSAEEEGEYQSIRNISFSLRPEYIWSYDASVTASEIAEEIVIKNEINTGNADAFQKSEEEDSAISETAEKETGTENQGKHCTFVNLNPYNGSGGESRWLTFIDENLGFSCLAYAAGVYGNLYRTEDGGSSWQVVEYPYASEKLSDGTYYNPYVMPEKVYEEDGVLFMEVGQGSAGDFYDAELGFCHGMYRSVDQGLNWEFVEIIPVSRK